MKDVVLLTVGAAVGFLAAHELNQTAQGRRFFANVRAKAREFTNALVDGYRTRKSELRTAGDPGSTDSARPEPAASPATAVPMR